MYPSASSPNATPTGFAVMSVSWDELIQPALLAGDKVKYTIVLRNVDPEIFLYQNAIINGSSVTVQADLTAYSIEVVNGTARNLGFIGEGGKEAAADGGGGCACGLRLRTF